MWCDKKYKLRSFNLQDTAEKLCQLSDMNIII